jgi:hypothetical protein
MRTFLKVIIATFLLIPAIAFGQNFSSDRQKDYLTSGENKVSNNKASIYFSADKGEISIKFDELNTTNTFKFTYLSMDEDEETGDIETVYTIIGDPTYSRLRVIKYLIPEAAGQSYYSYLFSLMGLDAIGIVIYSTSFYTNIK